MQVLQRMQAGSLTVVSQQFCDFKFKLLFSGLTFLQIGSWRQLS